MQNVVGVVLACLGLFAAVSAGFGVRPGLIVTGTVLFVGSVALLIDLDGS